MPTYIPFEESVTLNVVPADTVDGLGSLIVYWSCGGPSVAGGTTTITGTGISTPVTISAPTGSSRSGGFGVYVGFGVTGTYYCYPGTVSEVSDSATAWWDRPRVWASGFFAPAQTIYKWNGSAFVAATNTYVNTVAGSSPTWKTVL